MNRASVHELVALFALMVASMAAGAVLAWWWIY